MSTRSRTARWCGLLGAALVMTLPGTVHAVDGVTLINQARALDGSLDGDDPGFPVTITQPGSYRLSSNLVVPSLNVTAIRILTNDVTLDLNGFAILVASRLCFGTSGTPCPTDGSGVDAQSRQNVTVINGTVRGMGAAGVIVGGKGRVERIRALENGHNGITAGDVSIVTGNTVSGNAGYGIHAGVGSVVSGNTAERNITGIRVLQGSTVTGNSAWANTGSGFIAFGGSVLLGNVARQNQGFGLYGSSSQSSAYGHNVLLSNTSGSVGGLAASLGHNLCDGSAC